MWFITVFNGIITGKHCGDIPETQFFGTSFFGHEIIEISEEDSKKILENDKLNFYKNNWVRKTDKQLLDEKLIGLPLGFVLENETIRPMTKDEKYIAGLLPPPLGKKIENGALADMTMQEQFEAGQISESDYNLYVGSQNEMELDRKLAELNSDKAKLKAERDPDYAAERGSLIDALLSVEDQDGWPINVVWPD
jgi:hypothetical protein